VSKTNRPKGYLRFYPLLKWIFSALSVYFFIRQLRSVEEDLFGGIITGLVGHPYVFAVIVLLALVNWNAEAQKFKMLIAAVVDLSNIRALLTILGGMAISNFTPARTGEYIGRGLLLKSIHPIKVVIATVAGNIAQVFMTYSLGLICIAAALLCTDFGGGFTHGYKLLYVGILCILMLGFIARVKRILPWVMQRLPGKLANTLSLIQKYDKKLYSKVVGVAFLRYAVFASQFYLLLQLFSGFVMPISVLALIPIAYLMQSLVPVPAVSDVGVRVVVSQMLFGAFLTDDAILKAVTCIWFINLILPGILGTIYLLTSTIQKR